MQVGGASPRVERVPAVTVLEGPPGLLAQEECCGGGGGGARGRPVAREWPLHAPWGMSALWDTEAGCAKPRGVLEVPVVLSFSLSLLPRLPPTPPGAGPRSSLEKAGGGSQSPRLWSHVQEGLALAPGVPGGPPSTLFQPARGRGCVASAAMTSAVSPWLWRGCRMLLRIQLGLRSPRAGCQAGGPLFCLGLGAILGHSPPIPPSCGHPSWAPGLGLGVPPWLSGHQETTLTETYRPCASREGSRGGCGVQRSLAARTGEEALEGRGGGGQRGKGSQHAACREGAPAGGDPSAARGPGWGRPGRRLRVPLKGAQPALVSSHPLPWS
ncbi:uncharacterized protein LOC125154590 [Prionailurus viverrinus]|uniref:uncharacterized protein LOC125154590 n=1 Tax=Prionailurus viverrinus TaxID=61388 RepID=UPI001FF62007|nr:uncharacterized protein LOC125154590 [Prionailurus viverrinus]